MDPTVVPVISLGAAAFWVALAAVLIAGSYFKWRREALKQETLLRLVERTGQLDEQQVRTLFPPPPVHHFTQPPWERPSVPGGARRAMCIFGTVALFFAVGLAILFTILREFGTVPEQEGAIIGFGMASLIGCVGLGLLAASRFFPAASGNPEGRQAP